MEILISLIIPVHELNGTLLIKKKKKVFLFLFHLDSFHDYILQFANSYFFFLAISSLWLVPSSAFFSSMINLIK